MAPVPMAMPVVVVPVVIVAGVIIMLIMIMAGMVVPVVIVAGMVLMLIMIMAGMVVAVVIVAGMVLMLIMIMTGVILMRGMIMVVRTVLVSMPIRHRTHLSTEVTGDQWSSSLPQRPTRIGVDYVEYRRGPPRAFPAATLSGRAPTRRGSARFDTSHERSTTLASTMSTEVGG